MKREKIFKTLISQNISDKSCKEGKNDFLAFKVMTCANKQDVKRAVEDLFEVKVRRVGILNIKPTSTKSGKFSGKTKRWKKAYISLSEGYSINFMNTD